MAVRKIPLKEQPFLAEDGSTISRPSLMDQDIKPVEDLNVSSYHERIRESLLTDRALHDQVLMHVLSLKRC